MSASVTTPAPLVLQCAYCGAILQLNEDSPATRAAKTDPRQQLRYHIVTKHIADIPRHESDLGWLIDMLFFRCPLDPARWKANIESMLAYYLEQHQ